MAVTVTLFTRWSAALVRLFRSVTVTLFLARYTVPASVLCTLTVWLLFSTPSASRTSVTPGAVLSTATLLPEIAETLPDASTA